MDNLNSTTKDIKLPFSDTKTAVIYARVSTEEQVSNNSLKTQIVEMRKYIINKNLKEVGHFLDLGHSAKTTHRPQFQNMIDFIVHNKNKINYILVYKYDRFSRNTTDQLIYEEKLKKLGVRLISVTERVEDSASGNMLKTIYSSVAQFDNEQKGERVRHNMMTKAKDGWYPTKALYGYKNDPISKHLVKDDAYYEHIQYMLKEFANGASINSLTNYLKTFNVLTRQTKRYTPRNFTDKSVWKMLDKSRFYAGEYDWDTEKDIKGKHPKMITWNEHLHIQDRLHNKIYTIQRNEEDIFTLNFSISKGFGFTRCKNCGERLRTTNAKGNGGTYPYYYCKNSLCKIEKKSISKDKLEKLFSNQIRDIKPKPDYLDFFHSIMDEEITSIKKNESIAVNTITNELDTLRQSKKDTIAMRRQGELDQEDYNEEMRDIKDRIKILESRQVKSNLTNINFKQVKENSKYFFKNIEPIYNDFPISKKRDLATTFYPKGVLYEMNNLQTVQKSPVLEFFDGLEEGKVKMVTLRRIELRSSG